ncbi:hypothetical protein FDP41_004090 [Naegleria fowleri]|uniref:Uncharacterized protein n=1 Tax=Naegleria fowleri TaxID=5763 RepID=A0A6A5BTT1_NAEFO|nr:uncharacterized protein FDP41_004090 [Naegleria fowleri]KAF0976795.1 hypothetical protein FDP41_004090 [Naegleria fowleri]
MISRWLFFGCSDSNSASPDYGSPSNSFVMQEANSNTRPSSSFQIHPQQPPFSSFSTAQVLLYLFYVYLALIVTKCFILFLTSLYDRFCGNNSSSSSSMPNSSNLSSSPSTDTSSLSSNHVHKILSLKLHTAISQTWRHRKWIAAMLGMFSTFFIMIYSHHHHSSMSSCFSRQFSHSFSLSTHNNFTQIITTKTMSSAQSKTISFPKFATNHNSCVYSPAKHLANLWNMAKENALLGGAQNLRNSQKQLHALESLLRSAVNILTLTIKLLYVYLSLIGLVIIIRWLAFGSLSLNSAMHIYGPPAYSVTSTVASTNMKINSFRMP